MADLKQGDRVPLWVTVNHVHESGAVAYVPPHAIGTMWAWTDDIADVSELVEALRELLDCDPNTRAGSKAFNRAHIALAKFEAAND
jgi:hypothetical protein